MDLDLLVGALTAGSLYALVAMGFNILSIARPTCSILPRVIS
jgi:hypothetical protein